MFSCQRCRTQLKVPALHILYPFSFEWSSFVIFWHDFSQISSSDLGIQDSTLQSFQKQPSAPGSSETTQKLNQQLASKESKALDLLGESFVVLASGQGTRFVCCCSNCLEARSHYPAFLRPLGSKHEIGKGGVDPSGGSADLDRKVSSLWFCVVCHVSLELFTFFSLFFSGYSAHQHFRSCFL